MWIMNMQVWHIVGNHILFFQRQMSSFLFSTLMFLQNGTWSCSVSLQQHEPLPFQFHSLIIQSKLLWVSLILRKTNMEKKQSLLMRNKPVTFHPPRTLSTWCSSNFFFFLCLFFSEVFNLSGRYAGREAEQEGSREASWVSGRRVNKLQSPSRSLRLDLGWSTTH